MIPFLTVLDKCQYIASFWMLFSIWERPCVQKEMIKPNSKYVHITGYSWIKYQEKIYSLGDHSGNGKVTILRIRQKKLLKFWEARTIYPNGDHCRKFDVNPVKGSKVLSGHFICAVHENQLRSSSLFFGTMIGTGIYRSWFLSTEAMSWNEQKKIFPCTSSDTLTCDLSVYRGHLKEIYREVQTLVGKGRKSNLFLSASELMLKTHGVCPFSCIVCT